MIGAVLLGAALGGVLFAVLAHLAPPRTAPLVQLALFDARHGAPATPAHGPHGGPRPGGHRRWNRAAAGAGPVRAVAGGSC